MKSGKSVYYHNITSNVCSYYMLAYKLLNRFYVPCVAESSPAYTWTQSGGEITVSFTLPANIGKADIVYKLTTETIDVGIKNGHTLLMGMLFDRVDVEGSAWVIENQRLVVAMSKIHVLVNKCHGKNYKYIFSFFRLDVHLAKETEATWPTLVPSDGRGELVMDPNQVAQIHERLAHLTSETLVSSFLQVHDIGIHIMGKYFLFIYLICI